MNNNLPQKTSNNQVQSVIKTAEKIMDISSRAKEKIQYKAHATRKNPAAIVIMIDQSASMSQIMENGLSKAQITSDIVNSILQDTLMKCVKEDGIREYFRIMLLGYGENINSIWEGNLSGKDWITIEDLQENIQNIMTEETIKHTPFGIKSYKREKYKWISPRCDGKATSMKKAFDYCINKLNDWVIEFENSFPPLVFNITDGQPTDIKDDLNIWRNSCEELKSIRTNDGNTLLFNILLTRGNEVILPSKSEEAVIFKNNYHKIMYESSSNLPNEIKDVAYKIFKDSKSNPERILQEDARCAIFNSTASSLLHLITVGTTTIHNNARE